MSEPERSNAPDTASRVRVVLQLAGGGIAVVQGAILPLLGIEPSVPIFLGAVGMAGLVAPAIRIDALRRSRDEERSS